MWHKSIQTFILSLSGGNLVCPKPFVLYLSSIKCTKLVKTADLQAHNASRYKAECACRSAVFTSFVRQSCMMKQGFALLAWSQPVRSVPRFVFSLRADSETIQNVERSEQAGSRL